MPQLRGRVGRIVIHEEEGRTAWPLALSKIGWFAIIFLAPFSLFRFLNDLFGVVTAAISILALLTVLRLVGPINFVMFDEIISRVFPSLRTAFRTGRVRILNFRIFTEQGSQFGCALRGDLIGQGPVDGDDVTLTGDFHRGIFNVISGHNVTTNSFFSVRNSNYGILLIFTFALVICFCLYLRGEFDTWIYMAIDAVMSMLPEQ